ncbi:MAG: hypothetical protein KY476_03435 [Planctomycetes bacterium]|nr:hypothetical protein [Planctomycetota bacterium]
MIKRQQRLERIARVEQEYLAARTAASLLTERLRGNPSYGRDQGWESRAGADFSENLEATYLIRMYAEFEAGLRDYWQSHHGKDTRPAMRQLIRHAIPSPLFSQDCIDNADGVREYRNFLVHEADDEPPPHLARMSVHNAKRHLCTYFSRLDPGWR